MRCLATTSNPNVVEGLGVLEDRARAAAAAAATFGVDMFKFDGNKGGWMAMNVVEGIKMMMVAWWMR